MKKNLAIIVLSVVLVVVLGVTVISRLGLTELTSCEAVAITTAGVASASDTAENMHQAIEKKQAEEKEAKRVAKIKKKIKSLNKKLKSAEDELAKAITKENEVTQNCLLVHGEFWCSSSDCYIQEVNDATGEYGEMYDLNRDSLAYVRENTCSSGHSEAYLKLDYIDDSEGFIFYEAIQWDYGSTEKQRKVDDLKEQIEELKLEL